MKTITTNSVSKLRAEAEKGLLDDTENTVCDLIDCDSVKQMIGENNHSYITSSAKEALTAIKVFRSKTQDISARDRVIQTLDKLETILMNFSDELKSRIQCLLMRFSNLFGGFFVTFSVPVKPWSN